MDLQSRIDKLEKELARANEVIKNLKAKCFRLKMSNDCFLGVIKDLSDMFHKKFEEDNERD